MDGPRDPHDLLKVLGARELGRWLLLGAAHSMALGGAVWLVGEWLGSPETTVERLWLSFAWAAIGLAWLLSGTTRGDGTARSDRDCKAGFENGNSNTGSSRSRPRA